MKAIGQSSVEIAVEAAVVQIAAANDDALVRLARENDAVVIDLATKLGMSRQENGELKVQLQQLAHENECLREDLARANEQADLALLEVRGAA